MKLLVVTPTLGQSRWLAETVASVPAYCESLLVAPASAVAELGQRFRGVTVVPETGGGMYAALNAGLARVRDWDAFTYINDDDLLLPAFAAIAERARKGGNRIWYGGVQLIDAEGRRLGSIPISPAPEVNRRLYAQRIEPVYQHGTVITRAAFEQLGGFDPTFRFCGDSEFLARACLAGVAFECVTRREVAAFRLRAGQLTRNRPAMIAERARVDQKLRLLALPGRGSLRRARWRFRLANLGVYAERVARHGFVTFDELIVRADRTARSDRSDHS